MWRLVVDLDLRALQSAVGACMSADLSHAAISSLWRAALQQPLAAACSATA